MSKWGCSSNGRALALHVRGTGIDTPHFQIKVMLHFLQMGKNDDEGIWFSLVQIPFKPFFLLILTRRVICIYLHIERFLDGDR